MPGSSNRGMSPTSPSVASSSTMEDQEKLIMEMNELSEDGTMRRSTDMEFGKDEEQDTLLPMDSNKPTEPPKASVRTAVTWMVINTLATVGIVGFPHTHRARMFLIR